MKKLVYSKNDSLEPIYSMSQVGLDRDGRMIYYVNPDNHRVGDPYFKVYNGTSQQISTSLARISFLSASYIIHSNSDGKEQWILNSKEKKRLDKFLRSKSVRSELSISVWNHMKYLWNMEMNIFNDSDQFDPETFRSEEDAYMNGFYDTEINLSNPSYLASTLTQPDYTKLP